MHVQPIFHIRVEHTRIDEMYRLTVTAIKLESILIKLIRYCNRVTLLYILLPNSCSSQWCM